ncbi:hypothetical protein [Desulfonatronovibrio magnus]|uniref:hypothetical protein n=1 Tax=Desulfonatronovibrio magnus TaxID=698827 RepID=UPI0005EB2F25|nr:hypothetical protein [Desulfonatronovibrio magnus]
MVQPDLSFYQSFLRAHGIKYILGARPMPMSSLKQPVKKPVAAQPPVQPEVSLQPTDPPKPTFNTDIPAALLPYKRPAYSLWSYYELSLDIEQGFTNSRGALLNNIIKSLGWPQKDYTFWPLSSLEQEKQFSDRAIFFKGLSLIKPAYVFIFGAPAYNILFKNKDFSYGVHTLDEHVVVALPDLNSLLPDNRILKGLTWNILKQFSSQRY